MKLEARDIQPIIYNFLVKYGFTKLAEKFQKKADFEVETSKFSSLNLLKAVKYYCKAKNIEKPEDQKVEEKQQNNKLEKQDQGKDQVLEKKSKKEKKQKKEKDQEQQQQLQEEKKDQNKSKEKDKKNKNKKEKKVESEEKKEQETNGKSKNESEVENEKSTKSKKESKKKEEEISQINQQQNGEEQNASDLDDKENEKKRQNNVKESYDNYKRQKFGNILDQHLRQELKDNSVQAKTLYGNQGDPFAERGDKMLKGTRGKDFRKQKGKLKNKDFGIGGKISQAVNSVKL